MTAPDLPQVPQQPASVSPPYAPGPYPPPYYPRPPAKPTSFWGSPGGIFLVIFGVIMLISALCVGFGLIGGIGNRSSDSGMKADLTSCTFTGSEFLPSATVGYTVTNGSSRTRSVRIKFEYRDSGGSRIDTDTAYVRDVAPGDTVRGEETTILNATVSSGRCAIVDVS